MIHLEISSAIGDMRRVARLLIAPRVSLYYHYEHMARENQRAYIKGKTQVPTKKYLYVVRPLIMLLYLEQHDGALP